ncbi:general transcriptional corepressor trfA-like [Gossypium australe]|uniref:General transcriptional corepressor trfA-like n=1 Tax=Gossypium australe TaxID=47621 RepID=A0A5B6VAH4_9ROSI|nr:general transcriptional corepressor trfA-like [Gossypium australe]
MEQLHAITVRDEERPIAKGYKPQVPYRNVTKRDHTNGQFGKFLKLLKILHINLPFVEALLQMPNYVKFLKELLGNKRKLDDSLNVELNAVCSAILQNKLPNKLKDPGSFTIPCLIGSLSIKNALVDLRASINVMPYKMFKQLGLRKPKQTRMTIARTIIDVGTGELVLRVGDEMITLQACDSMRVSSNRDEFKCSVKVSNHVAQLSLQEIP